MVRAADGDHRAHGGEASCGEPKAERKGRPNSGSPNKPLVKLQRLHKNCLPRAGPQEPKAPLVKVLPPPSNGALGNAPLTWALRATHVQTVAGM